MSKPSLTLSMIIKNEAENLPRIYEAAKDCFDEWLVVDTGSTDNSMEIAKSLGARVIHFPWINDFSAARNFGLENVKTDYAWWQDGDDVLLHPENFKDFWDHSLQYFDYVLANYNYAIDRATGKPIVSFMRERIFKMSCKPRFNYFVHEGVAPWPGSRAHMCTNWAINHLRTEEDQAKDKSRNLNIFEEQRRAGKLDGRLTFYYGKELFENNKSAEAIPILHESIERNDVAPHDKILAVQYACYAALQELEKVKPEFQFEGASKIIEMAMKGLILDQKRAEFWIIIADCYFRFGRMHEALPFYAAAANCTGVPMAGDPFTAPIHSFAQLYRDYPRNKMAAIYANTGNFDESRRLLNESISKWDSAEGKQILAELDKVVSLTRLDNQKEKVEDIVFTCPPQTAYQFDEELYKTKGMGGSETALIEMAKELKKKTGRPVKVFNMRNESLFADSGVQYISTNHIPEYFARYEPKVHIAWRHNLKLTNAPSYLWCHDLMIPGVEHGLNVDKVLCLSPFHRDFLASSQGVPRERILQTRNGIAPEKWAQIQKVPKNPYKFVYASSPDRGLDRCMKILDLVREKYPVELHVYYGLDNLYTFGQGAMADNLKKMMEERPWVKYHGFTEQKKMYAECADAAMIVHPNDFIETFCITALEMPISGVYMITRRWGAIADTLKPFEDAGMAKMLDCDSVTPEEHRIWADECIKAIEEKRWENISVSPERYSWRSVAGEWVKMFDLWPKEEKPLEERYAIGAEL